MIKLLEGGAARQLFVRVVGVVEVVIVVVCDGGSRISRPTDSFLA